MENEQNINGFFYVVDGCASPLFETLKQLHCYVAKEPYIDGKYKQLATGEAVEV